MDPTQTVNEGQVPQAPAPVVASLPPVAPVMPTAQPVVQAPVAPEMPPAQPTELPNGSSPRTTEQFDKLKDSNRRLYEANQLLQQQLSQKAAIEQQFAPIQQPQAQPPTSQPQSVKSEQFIETDPVTGEQFVNEDRLKTAISDANTRATRAEQAVQTYIQQQQQREEQKQTEEAYRAYPELNPGGMSFDGELTRRTRRILLDSMVSPADYGGRPFTFKEAADLAKLEMGPVGTPAAQLAPPTQQPQQTVSQEGLENKQQAALAAQGVSSSAQQAAATASNENEGLRLRDQTRKGGDTGTWALAKRLTKIDHTGIPKSSNEA